MREKILIIILSLFGTSLIAQEIELPLKMQGTFTDDYGSIYEISNAVWLQDSVSSYEFVEINEREQYLIVKNSKKNPAEKGKFTRIDWMEFEGMNPFLWGYCYTNYKAKSVIKAKESNTANREDPMKGCNGYPFSRMKHYMLPK